MHASSAARELLLSREIVDSKSSIESTGRALCGSAVAAMCRKTLRKRLKPCVRRCREKREKVMVEHGSPGSRAKRPASTIPLGTRPQSPSLYSLSLSPSAAASFFC